MVPPSWVPVSRWSWVAPSQALASRSRWSGWWTQASYESKPESKKQLLMPWVKNGRVMWSKSEVTQDVLTHGKECACGWVRGLSAIEQGEEKRKEEVQVCSGMHCGHVYKTWAGEVIPGLIHITGPRWLGPKVASRTLNLVKSLKKMLSQIKKVKKPRTKTPWFGALLLHLSGNTNAWVALREKCTEKGREGGSRIC